MCRYVQTGTLAVSEKSRGEQGPVPIDRGLGAPRFRPIPRKRPDDQTFRSSRTIGVQRSGRPRGSGEHPSDGFQFPHRSAPQSRNAGMTHQSCGCAQAPPPKQSRGRCSPDLPRRSCAARSDPQGLVYQTWRKHITLGPRLQDGTIPHGTDVGGAPICQGRRWKSPVRNSDLPGTPRSPILIA